MENRKLAVGWFDNKPFQDVCAPYLARIKEVFFAWPGVTASRPMDAWTGERRARLVADLAWARAHGVELDTIFNANCYGDIAMTETLADHVSDTLRDMDAAGLFPDHLTTTSPFIATVVRRRFPSVKIRWSINMDIATTDALDYVTDLFDSFYAGRNRHRSLDYVKEMSAWAAAHGKTMGMQANPGCLKNCPYHTFHNNLHGHNRIGQSEAAKKFGFTNFLCRVNYERGRYEDFLRAIWIRPEDLPRYEPYVGVVKLATRRHPWPEKIIAAYAECRYEGDLAEIVDPFYRFPKIMDNAALGASPLWPVVRDSEDTGTEEMRQTCKALLADVFKDRPASSSSAQTFSAFFRG